MPDRTRPVIGALALALVAAAAVAMWILEQPTAAGLSLRSGIILGAVWLAWPELVRRSVRRLAIIGIGVLVVLLRPRAAWVVVPALLIWLGMGRR